MVHACRLACFLAASCALLGQPQQMINLQVGAKTTFTVPDPFSDCTLTILVSNTNPNVASIFPGGPMVNVPTGQDQLFTITGLTPGNTLTTLNTTGVGGLGQNCGFRNDVLNIAVGSLTSLLPTDQQVIFTGYDGDPVSTATGELYDAGFAPDLSLGGPLPLYFLRYYASLIDSNGIVTAIGKNWMHNFEFKLTITGTNATVLLFGGKTIGFQQSGNNWTLTNPDLVGYQLVNGPGTNRQFLDPASNLIYTFDSSGRLIKIEDRNGNALTVTQPVNGSAQVTDGLGRSIAFTYTNGNLVKVQDQTGRSVSFAYNGNDLAQVTDANGKVETYSYTTAGNQVSLMTTRTLPAGNKPFNQVWNSSGKVVKQSDSRGNATTYAYDPAGVAPTVVTDALGGTQQQVHTNYKNETSYTDQSGNTFTIGYDANGHRVSVADRLGDKTSATYHSPSGYPATVTDALGNTTTYTYISQTQGSFTVYLVSKIQYADGTSVSIAYDNLGNATSVTDPAGKVTKFTYNSRGQVLTIANPTGAATTSTYNADGTVATVTDPFGNTVTYSYDDKKRPVQAKFADGSTVSVVYDNRDNVLKTTDERGKAVTAAYNDNNQVKSVTDPLGNVATPTYDNDERVSAATDPLGKTTNFAYNELGLFKTQTNPAGDLVTYGYDKQHRVVSAADASGKGFTIAYDKEDVPTSVTDALSRTVTFTTDKLGRTTQVATPLGETSKTVFDKLGRVVSVTDPLGNTGNFNYDARGLMTSMTLPLGISASYGLTDLGLVGTTTDPNGNVWTRSFDSAGRLMSGTDPLGRATSVTYDNRSRVATVTSPQGTETFTYDAAGNLARNLFSDGTDMKFTYDDDNRLLSGPGFNFTYDGNGNLTSSNGLLIGRDADGRISSIVYATGKVVTYTYDVRGLLISVADWLGGTTTLAYDDARQLVQITRPNGTNTKFSYDKDGRLSGLIESGGSSVAVQRDAAGQETSLTRTQLQAALPASGTMQLAYDAAHQISGDKYDGLGRLLNDGLRSYSWNLASRLVSYQGADGAAMGTYDGLGLRISNSGSGTTQNYILNYALGLPSIATVQDAANKDLRYYIHLPSGTLLYFIEAADNSRHYYHFDEIGSTTFLTNDSGAITDSYGIMPFGELVTPGASNATNNPFTWLGAYGVMQEGSTSLYYMRQRWYDSSAARFLSPDPVGSQLPTRINPYQYVEANPITRADPLGLDDLDRLDRNVNEDNELLPDDVTFDSPNDCRFIRIKEVRARARQLRLSSTLIPTQIVGFVSITTAPYITINNPQQTLAYINQGTRISGLSIAGNSYGGSGPGIAVTNVNVREGLAQSFQLPSGFVIPGLVNPGPVYNTKSAFQPSGLLPGGDLQAGFRTRILLRSSNIGTGTRVLLPGVAPLTTLAPANEAPPAAVGGWSGGYLTLIDPHSYPNQVNPSPFLPNVSGFRTAPGKLKAVSPDQKYQHLLLLDAPIGHY